MLLKIKKQNISIASSEEEFSGSFHMEDVGKYLFEQVDADLDENPDLIGAVFDLAVIDEFNYNQEGVSFDVAKKFVERFKNKPTDYEHKLKKIIGHCVNACITKEFSVNTLSLDGPKNFRMIVKEEEEKEEGARYYITVACVFYAIPDEQITKMILSKPDILKGSWEILTNDYAVWVEKEKTNLSRVPYSACERIAITDEVDAALKQNKGSGRLADGRRIFKDILNYVAPFGLAITTIPAADVGPMTLLETSIELDEEGNAMIELKNENESESSEDDCGEDEDPEIVDEASFAVALNKPFRNPSGSRKKFSVYVKNDKGNTVKVQFGDPNMEIRRDDKEARKNFRARHQCDTNPGPKWKARYWSCRMWDSDSVSEIISSKSSEISAASVQSIETILEKSVKDFNNMRLFIDKLKASFASAGLQVGDDIVTSINDMFLSSMREENAKFVSERDSSIAAKADLQSKFDTLSSSIASQNQVIEDLQKKYNEAVSQIDSFNKEKEEKAAIELYENRLSEIKNRFELSDAEMSVVAKQIGKLDTVEASFASFLEDFTILNATKTKEAIAEAKARLAASTATTAPTDEQIINLAKEKISKKEISLASLLPEGSPLPNIADRADENAKLLAKFDKAAREGLSFES